MITPHDHGQHRAMHDHVDEILILTDQINNRLVDKSRLRVAVAPNKLSSAVILAIVVGTG